MKLQPVKKLQQPGYPTQDYLREHPELLHLVPNRWQRNRIVLTALGSTVLLMLSCRNSDSEKILNRNLLTQTPGIIMTPSSFSRMNEAEVCHIIEDEAEQAGICFENNTLHIKYNPAYITTHSQGYDSTVDGYDRKHNIAYEFVNQNDASVWAGEQTLKFKESFADPKTTIAVFYFGHLHSPDIYETMNVDGKRKIHITTGDAIINLSASKQLFESEVRAQVRDFIQWLKSEGII